jgi:hypothetical protein
MPQCWKRERNIDTFEKRNSSRFPMQLIFSMLGSFHPVECDGFSRHCLCCVSSRDSLGLMSTSNDLDQKKLSEAPLPRLTSSIDVWAFNLKWSLGPRMTFSWRDQKGWVHRVTYEIIAIWLGSEQIPCRILGRIYRYKSTIKAEWSQESTHETTTIWLEDRHEPMSTLGWEWTICK